MRSASSGLRHPASASCLGRHSRLAGRCPNNSSLFPPLAAVVVVAAERIVLNFGFQESLRTFPKPIFTGGVVKENGICSAAFCESTALRESFLALSGANAPDSPFCRCATSSPGAGEVFPQRERPWQRDEPRVDCQGLPLWGSWQIRRI